MRLRLLEEESRLRGMRKEVRAGSGAVGCQCLTPACDSGCGGCAVGDGLRSISGNPWLWDIRAALHRLNAVGPVLLPTSPADGNLQAPPAGRPVRGRAGRPAHARLRDGPAGAASGQHGQALGGHGCSGGCGIGFGCRLGCSMGRG